MSSALEGMKPELLWKYFGEISRIPRCSRNEMAVAGYVLETAQRLGLEALQDDIQNIVVRKPATPGCEAFPTICLQGHLDMVCEKNSDKVHDFSKDPIELVRRDNLLMANGTTLGADNGIAVATHLAIMEDNTLEHGPLEFLFTIDEETALTGAANLSPDLLKSHMLMNLDSEEEGALYVGCAGGQNTNGTWALEYKEVPKKSVAVLVSVRGLRGGHSGLDIEKGRANAIKLLNRVIMKLIPIDARLSRIDGGNKHNAIPREADALLFIPKKRFGEASAIVEEMNASLFGEFGTVETDLKIDLTPAQDVGKARVLKKAQQLAICRTLSAIPHGVTRMSADIPGLVETSTNLATITTAKKTISIVTSQRSSVASALEGISQSVASTIALGGARVEQGAGYPGWKPNLESPILKLAQATYKKMYGKEPEVKAIHAGLECGLIGEKYPAMDMVSFGPTLESVHSPDERIYIDTVEKYWDFLLGILKSAGTDEQV